MSKILIITSPDVAIGFRLSGVDVREIDKPEEMAEALAGIMRDGVYGLLAVEETLLSKLPAGMTRRLEKLGKPIIVPLTIPKEWAKREETETYVARLIRKAIGYQIKIKR